MTTSIKYLVFICTYLSLLGVSSLTQAQIPAGYYDAAIGKTGNELKIALHNIIKGHTSLSYSGLWSAYSTTDKIPGTSQVWDIYSNNPGGTTAYTFTLSSDQCSGSSPSSEGHCYNREHLFPQSLFDGNLPMYSDLWIVYPTDAFVNSKRASYPFGEVNTFTWMSSNGSKLGTNSYPGAPTTLCFEPHDSFKGDIARSYFYIATRYYSLDGSWDTWEMSSGADLKPWAKAMLLEWHHMDPVSEKEILRNNSIYGIQHNRNPFIDHPEFADCIFGTADCSELLSIDPTIKTQQIEVYPNPTSDILEIKLNKDLNVKYVVICNTLGQEMPVDITPISTLHWIIQTNKYVKGHYYVLLFDEEGHTYTTQFTKF